MNKYYKCDRCGGSLATNINTNHSIMCTLPVPYRTSGICGGSISSEITYKEYLNIKSMWRTERRRKKIERIIK